MTAAPLSGWQIRCLRAAILGLSGTTALAAVFGDVAGYEVITPRTLCWVLAASAAVTGIVYAGASVVTRDADTRTILASICLIGWSLYATLGTVAVALGLGIPITHGWAAMVYAAAVAIVATALLRPRVRKRRDLLPWLFLALSLTGGNLSRGLVRLATTTHPPTGVVSPSDLRTIAHAEPPRERRDVFYLVFDALGREDTLRSVYDYDMAPFVSFLREQGFYVADGARSNYSQTLMSFPSFLNMNYLNDAVPPAERATTNRISLVPLIRRNALMQLAHNNGYRITAIGSDYAPMRTFAQADTCVCAPPIADTFEQAVFRRTALLPIPFGTLIYESHRQKVLSSLAAIDHVTGPGPHFVFAHILAPHPPFIFAADGSAVRPDRPFALGDGDQYPGSREEYMHGYRGQVAFITSRLRTIIASLMNRPGPRPVIVIHGDHGPGSMLNQKDMSATDIPERMNIFAAYYFPNGQGGLYSSITPVNAVRALARGYLGAQLGRLPDRSYFSPLNHPFDLHEVPAESDSLVKAYGR